MMVAGKPCHLSAPHGFSVNDYIDPDSFTLTHCSVDDAYVIVNSPAGYKCTHEQE